MTPTESPADGLRRHPAWWLATWFGAGSLPVAPGTWGSLAALPFAWAIASVFEPWALAVAAAALFPVGCWASAIYMRRTGKADPGPVVIDEVVGQWLTLAVAPAGWLPYAIGFLLFRVADVLKPWPASWADRGVHGGLGVMLDDVFAAVYAGAGLYLLMWWIG